MKPLEISGLIEERMWVDNPLVEPPTIEQISAVDGPSGWEAHRLTLTTLTGTYLEASAHIDPCGQRISSVDPSRFVVPAVIYQLSGIGAGTQVKVEHLEACHLHPEPGEAILVSTGWDRCWNTPGYVEESPSFTLDAIEWILEHQPGIVGADVPSFDNPATAGRVVRTILQSDCLLLGPLVNLTSAVHANMLLIALPLRIAGVCGAPCRAVLIDYHDLKEALIPYVRY